MTVDDLLKAAIFEKVSLSPHDPAWARRYESERERLLALLPERFLEIQHIGSTAVPGIPAKPVIDILAGVRSMEVADQLVPVICESGYTTSAEFNATL